MKQYNALDSAVATIPSQWYYEPEFFQKECQTLWAKKWVFVSSADALDKPLSYKTVQVGTQNIVVLKDRNHAIKAYHNTCRHRGSILCPQSSGQLKTNNLVCPYHQWSYSASDGALKGVTSFQEPQDFCKSDHGLFPVQVHVWRQLVFINLDPQAEWQDSQVFQCYDELLNNYPLEEMKLGYEWRTTIKSNWKIYWENFSECLHCPNVHPELVDLVPLYSRRLMDTQDTPNWTEEIQNPDPKYQGGLKDGVETWSLTGSAQGHAIEGISTHEQFKGQSYCSTWPSMFMGAFADHIRTVRILPIDHEHTELVAQWLFEEKTLNNAQYDQNNVIDFAKLVMHQDGAACEWNQQGVKCANFSHGTLMPEEYVIRDFHEWLVQSLEEK